MEFLAGAAMRRSAQRKSFLVAAPNDIGAETSNNVTISIGHR
jgi:hypothetical protein